MALQQRRDHRLRITERQRRARIIKRASVALIALVVLGVAGWLASRAYQSYSDNRQLGGVQSFQETQNHVETPVQYNANPPAGGDHSATWQTCGYYAAPVAGENAAHSQEHGAVWITYQPELPQDQINALRSIAENQSYVIVSPLPGLSSPVVASGWGKQLTLNGANDPALNAFLRKYRQGSNAPESGATCSGGTTATQTS